MSHYFTIFEDYELWNVIEDGSFVPTKHVQNSEVTYKVSKTIKEFNDADRRQIEKKYMAKKLLVCGMGPDEYNRISTCENAKEIWDCLQTTHEETSQVKESKVDMLTA